LIKRGLQFGTPILKKGTPYKFNKTMKNNKIRVLFVLNKVKINKREECPIKCRITFLGKRKVFSTSFFINPDHWKSKQQKATLPDDNYINNQLSLIKQEINQAFLCLQVNSESFDVGDVYLQFKGESTKENKTLLEAFILHNNRMGKLIGKEYTRSTFHKFKEAKMHVGNFLKSSYKKNDILLEAIKSNFLNDFDFYLKTAKNHKQITINKSIQRVRKIIKLAISEGFISKDPFLLYRPKRVVKNIVFLTTEELKSLEEYSFKQNRLQLVKELFVFCCYTGLAYQEMSTLKANHIVIGFDGKEWIEMYRLKTKSNISVPLLPKAKAILVKYDNQLPSISNQKFNSYLKEIAEVVGIEKRLTHHIARKTFATTVLLYNNVPIEIVSQLLGHSNMKITQDSYAKVVNRKVSDEIKRLSEKIT
jgi:integrase/recombinase XerD